MYLSKGISTGVVLLSAIFPHSGFPDIIVWIEKISLKIYFYRKVIMGWNPRPKTLKCNYSLDVTLLGNLFQHQ